LILSHLAPDFPWRDRILWFPTVDSTNNLAKELAAQGAPHGTVLIADCQTGGRGRKGRSFHSPAGTGIYLTLLLRPVCAPSELMHLTCAAAVAMCDAVERAARFRPGIKWTNDLVFGKRKLGGILTELKLGHDGRIDYALIGIGINCSQQPEDFPPELRSIAGSLATAAGRPADRISVIAAMLDSLLEMDRSLLTGKARMLTRYRSDCITLGKDIALVRADGSVRHGTAVDIDEEGALTVLFPSGETEVVNSGEVSVRGMYGYVE